MTSICIYSATGEGQSAKVVAAGEADTSRDDEYTDWASADVFAGDFAAFVAEHHGTVERVVGKEAE